MKISAPSGAAVFVRLKTFHILKPQKTSKSLRCNNDCDCSQTEIPYMTGWTASEGGFMVSLLYDSLEETGADWDSVGPFFTGLTINQVRRHRYFSRYFICRLNQISPNVILWCLF